MGLMVWSVQVGGDGMECAGGGDGTDGVECAGGGGWD